MGYDIYASGMWMVPAEKAAQAIQAMLLAVAEKDGYSSVEDWISTEEPVPNPLEEPHDYISDRLVNSVVGETDSGELTLEFNDDSFRHQGDDEELWEAAAPFCAEGGSVEFTGEDNHRWAWTVLRGKLAVLDSETFFGNDTNAPATIGKLVEMLYPDGKPASTLPEYDAGHIMDKGHSRCLSLLESIETLLREGGFGPQAGMNELERMADV